MSRRLILPAMALAIAAALTVAPAEAKKHDNKNANVGAALIGGLVAGAVIGAAVSDTKTHPKQIYVAPPPPRAQPFSPKSGITCYPAQQACYRYDGAYNSNWTWKIYAH